MKLLIIGYISKYSQFLEQVVSKIIPDLDFPVQKYTAHV